MAAGHSFGRRSGARRGARRLALGGALLALAGAPAGASAQPVPPSPEPAPSPGPAAPAPDPGAPPAPDGPKPGAAPRIVIDDAMLAPLPPPQHQLASFREAVTMLSAHTTDLRVSRYEIERAEGAADEALGKVLPTLTATGTALHHFIRNDSVSLDASGNLSPTTIPTTPVVTGSLTASVPILAAREWYAVDTAERAVDALRHRSDDVERRVLGGTASALLAVVTAEKVGDINRSGLRVALERLELERLRAKHEVGKRIDLLRIQQDVARARAGVVNGDEGLRRAREALGLSLGTTEPWGVAPSVSVGEVEADAARACQPNSAADRADVLAARADLEVAERGVTDSELLFVPRADLSTTGTVSSDLLGVNRLHGSWSVQATLTWPIYDGGVRYGTMRRTRAIRDEQQARLEGLERSAGIESQQAARGVRVAEEGLALAVAQRDLAHEAADLAARAYEAGDTSSFELIESARQARDADLALALSEYDLIQARIAALLTSATCHF